MPTITEVSEEVPKADPSDGTEDVVEGQVKEQEQESKVSDKHSDDESDTFSDSPKVLVTLQMTAHELMAIVSRPTALIWSSMKNVTVTVINTSSNIKSSRRFPKLSWKILEC